MRRMLTGCAVAISCSAIMGCGSTVARDSSPEPVLSQSPPAAVPTPSETVSHGSSGGPLFWPGAFGVRYGGTHLELGPSTYCYTGGCVDGVQEDAPSVGSPEELWVFVPVPEFDELIVTQCPRGDECVSSLTAQVEDLGGGWWRVRPSGPAQEYRVMLFASGDGFGDMVADVTWHTPADEDMPEQSATGAEPGTPDSTTTGSSPRPDG